MAKKKMPSASKSASKSPSERKKVLHVGCGIKDPARLHQSFQNRTEWQEVRLDINPDVDPDIIGDITDMHDVAENSHDALYSSHNLEHLYPHQVPTALKEFFRVLKPGGHVLLTMPNLQEVAYYVAAGKLEEPIYRAPAGPISAIDILYGLRSKIAEGNTFMAHRGGFTAESLGRKLKDAGFVNVRVQRDGLNLWARGEKITDPKAKVETRINIQDVPRNAASPSPPVLEPAGWPDALDRPPMQWKPLGLKKAS